MAFSWKDQVVLVTGGTGSFGQKFVKMLLAGHQPRKVIIFSRDELKQYEMAQTLTEHAATVRFFLGDVRDRERLYRAFDGVDIVIHAAALKQVPAAEYNPIEAIRTNILGAANIVDAAIDRGVKRIIALSTDKAVNPINLYGATKLCSDKLFVSANSYVGGHVTRMCVVRYGNVMGSRGSVIPLFLKQRPTGKVTLTDLRMTRFWITLTEGVELVMNSLERMQGGEIYVPKIASMRVTDVARALAPGCTFRVTGIRPGEKLHEVLITEDDARNTLEFDDHFAILPAQQVGEDGAPSRPGGKPCPEGFRYASDTNDRWLTQGELLSLIEDLHD